MNNSIKFKLSRYVKLLAYWNNTINVLGINDCSKIMNGLINDTLSGWEEASNYIKIESYEKLVDLGAGGGIVGIPIGITNESIKVFLVEANKKKCYILDKIVKELTLNNVFVLNGRAESLSRDKDYREQFSVVIVKAVGRLETLVELSFPLLKINGDLIAYKSGKSSEEIGSMKGNLNTFNGQVNGIYHYGGSNNIIVHIKKLSAIDDRFPRRDGLAQRKPIF